jgi:hypothetical protein
MNWMNHSMGWPGMLLFWLVSVFLIVMLMDVLADWMDRESPKTADEGISKQDSPAPTWLGGLRTQFNDWRHANADAHAKSKPTACCAAPPPGAGSQPRHGTGMH